MAASLPSTGDSNSIVALSVSISAMIWPSLSVSPTETFQLRMRPSSMVLPAWGMRMGVSPAEAACDGVDEFMVEAGTGDGEGVEVDADGDADEAVWVAVIDDGDAAVVEVAVVMTGEPALAGPMVASSLPGVSVRPTGAST